MQAEYITGSIVNNNCKTNNKQDKVLNRTYSDISGLSPSRYYNRGARGYLRIAKFYLNVGMSVKCSTCECELSIRFSLKNLVSFVYQMATGTS